MVNMNMLMEMCMRENLIIIFNNVKELEME